MPITIKQLPTEGVNPQTQNLDRLDTLSALRCINELDQHVAGVVATCLPMLAQAVELAVEKLENGGRIVYLGAGTSGRLGVLDALECPPTYGIAADRVVGLCAGGLNSFARAGEAVEDDPQAARDDLAAIDFSKKDILVGIAASGRTPYVGAGLLYARDLGAPTALICNVPEPQIGSAADVLIAAVTGAEAVSGSTRMKAGTAQKLLLNMFSTVVMVRLGKVYQNLMVDVSATNEKLRQRACDIVVAATDVTQEQANDALSAVNGSSKAAILMCLSGCNGTEALARLDASDGYLRKALSMSAD